LLRIRLTRLGKKKQPTYRIVVADSRAPRDGAFIEIIGHYDPLPDPAKVVINDERAIEWLKAGARPSDTAAKLLSKAGIMEKAGLKPFVHAPAQAAAAAASPPKTRKAKSKEPTTHKLEEPATQEVTDQQIEQEAPTEASQESSPDSTE